MLERVLHGELEVEDATKELDADEDEILSAADAALIMDKDS